MKPSLPLSSVSLLGYAWPAGVSLCPAEYLFSLLKVQDTISLVSPEITAFITSLTHFIMYSCKSRSTHAVSGTETEITIWGAASFRDSAALKRL